MTDTINNNADAAGRRLMHERQINCKGYLRPDGLWDIEGRLADCKTHAVTLTEGRVVAAGETYHGMLVRVTLNDEFVIQEVAVEMPQVPTSECRGAAHGYTQLVGMQIGPGFTRRVKHLFGGIQGCVHLTELLLPIATTAYQTIPMARAMVAPRNEHDAAAYIRATSGLVDTCHALRANGPIAMRIVKRQVTL